MVLSPPQKVHATKEANSNQGRIVNRRKFITGSIFATGAGWVATAFCRRTSVGCLISALIARPFIVISEYALTVYCYTIPVSIVFGGCRWPAASASE